MPIGIFKMKRAKDDKIITKETKYNVLKDACFGYDLFFKQKKLKGYSVTDKETGKVLVSKGDIT